MALSESSSVASASAAPPRMSTEFSRPRRPKRRCSMLSPFCSLSLLSFPLHLQRNHLEGPHTETQGTSSNIDRPFGLFEKVGALHSTDATGGAQRTFPARSMGFVEA